MAREIYSFDSGEIAIAAATRKVILGIHCPNSYYVRALIKSFNISANGIVAAGKPVYCRFCVASQALASGTAVSPGVRSLLGMNFVTAGSPSVQNFCEGKHSPTLPTTNVRVIKSFEIHPNGGAFGWQFPRGEEPECVGTSLCYWIDAIGDTVLSLAASIDVEE